MHDSPARTREVTPQQVGSDKLAEGLMLVRASTLKMIRLHLALERHDRRVVLEAVDELVALDRRLEDYLANVPARREPLLFRNGLDAERAALNREKLTLAAEVIRREATPDPAEVEAPEPTPWNDFEFAAEPERHRSVKWLAFLLIVLAVAAGTAYAFASPAALASTIAQLRALS